MMERSKISFRSENGVVENHKFFLAISLPAVVGQATNNGKQQASYLLLWLEPKEVTRKSQETIDITARLFHWA
jgi:hypothetical protein